MKRINVDLLGIGQLLKGVKYLIFPASAGTDLVRDVVEAAAEAEGTEVRTGEHESRDREENRKG